MARVKNDINNSMEQCDVDGSVMLEDLLDLGDGDEPWPCTRPGIVFPSPSQTILPNLPLGTRHTAGSSSREDAYESDIGDSDGQLQHTSDGDDQGRSSGSPTKRSKTAHRRVMTAEERIERRREGNRRAAQRLRARRVATVAELKDQIVVLEYEKQAFMEDLSHLATSCQLVVEENQWLRSRLETLEKPKIGKDTLRHALSSSLARLADPSAPQSPLMAGSGHHRSVSLPISKSMCHRSPSMGTMEPMAVTFNELQGPPTPGGSPSGFMNTSTLFNLHAGCLSPTALPQGPTVVPSSVPHPFAPASPLPALPGHYMQHPTSCSSALRAEPTLDELNSLPSLPSLPPLFDWLT